MKKLFFCLLIAALSVCMMPEQAQAQRRGSDYGTSVGVRLAPFYGASIKHFFSGSSAVEGILHSSFDAVKVTGLYEMHMPAFDEPGLRFYYGGGAHIGFGGSRYYQNFDNTYTGLLVGVDGIVGMEYTLQDRNIPLNASLDWKPVIDIVQSGVWFRGAEIGLTVRYIFRY